MSSTSRSTSPEISQQLNQPFRPLMPAPPGMARIVSPQQPAFSHLFAFQAQPTGSSSRRKQGKTITAACGACRKRKSKCDGTRPTCLVCREKGTPCEYDTNVSETHAQALKRKYQELQTQKAALEQVYSLLQTRPEEEARAVYRRIRLGEDPTSVLRHAQYGDVVMQHALEPQSNFRYEFPYLREMPPFLVWEGNPYLRAEIHDWEWRASVSGSEGSPLPQRQRALLLLPGTTTGTGDDVASPRSTSSGTSETLSAGSLTSDRREPYLKPYHTARVVHPWLDSVKPSMWTGVSDDDVLMRKLLHDYILFDWDWFTMFHKDYFLEDMAQGRRRFCSSLLVNAVLCMGSYCHRGLRSCAEHWNPKSFCYQFLAEARRLFDIDAEEERPVRLPDEQDADWHRRLVEWEQRRLCTIQAAILINLIQNINGADKIGWRVTVRALELAREIKLFDEPPEYYGPEMVIVRTYTAWACYCWQSLSTFFYLRPPLIKDPPKALLPDPIENPQWYGELWIAYPGSTHRFPTYHGLSFKAKCEFWRIITEIGSIMFAGDRSPIVMPLKQTLHYVNRLRDWLHGLPEPLSPSKIVFPQHLKLHLGYYYMLIEVISPIIGCTEVDGVPLNPTPYDLYLEAVNCHETLIRIHYLRHGFEGFDTFMLHFLGFNNHLAIRAVETSQGSSYLEPRRSSVILFAKGIHEFSQALFIAKAILKLQVGRMQASEAELLRRELEIEPEEVAYGPMEQTVQSDWPEYDVGVEAKAERVKEGKTLATSLAELSLLERERKSASPER
ncbi:uncharacterized protein CTHT_0060450 [Thermochaetoides thermophila DSM 1495]|uniref:Zn(2)-C6 fungal-type domain-containing protein n=1 Tax=Chaetomium thermophilum (strain DSM 1495 / CBS 144.50 / IMI 039719) TaxID=759272 RepID=G0SF15_CHATD|nr:hypothetical protein CTHT_0060450 [Thermochaetoides thermophila DSM 1495]EGS18031.1 hypothetical protein CTHT_0060450 [Thermochaetoides thermophila DSM 1495]